MDAKTRASVVKSLRSAAAVLSAITLDSLPEFSSVEELVDHLRKLPRPDLESLQKELDELHERAVAPYASMESLFHGAPNKILDAIRASGFKLTKGQRSGFMGSGKFVQNLAVFLTEDKKLAQAFGANRDPHEGRDSGVLEVRADLKKTLDMTKWGNQVPKDLRSLGLKLIREHDGSRVRKPRQEDLFWLIDQPEFVDAVKAAHYDSVRFAESTATKKYLGLEKTAGDTIAVLDPKRLHLMPLPLSSPRGMFNYLKAR